MERWLRTEVGPLLGAERTQREAATAGLRAVIAFEIEGNHEAGRHQRLVRVRALLARYAEMVQQAQNELLKWTLTPGFAKWTGWKNRRSF